LPTHRGNCTFSGNRAKVKTLRRIVHRTDGYPCPCGVKIEQYPNGIIILHNDELGRLLNLEPRRMLGPTVEPALS